MSARILLVEDDPDSQALIRALCERHGATVDTAADGFAGLRLLSEGGHDVALIDYHLPEMDGYALARLMRGIGRPGAPVRLVGITADRHGLVARRGADALFDAILVKPVEPEGLFATLDRLTARAAPREAAPPSAATAADTLWRRRGLPGRPRALVCPPPGPEEAEAIAHAFALAGPEEADVVLVSAEAGLESLRAARAAGPARLLPSFDLTGRLGAVCDGAFRVEDGASWSRLADLSRGFARRRADLSPALAGADDAAARLHALLSVADRALVLTAAAEGAYETGQPRAALMAAVLALTEAGALTCEPGAAGVVVRLTEAGRRAAAGDAPVCADRPAPDAALGPPAARHWHAPHVAPHAAPLPDAAAGDEEPSAGTAPAVNARTIENLRRLIGAAEVERLQARLLAQIETAFAPEADLATVAHQAHALIAMAGSLGFDRLSGVCRDLQAAIRQGRDVERPLGEARRACGEAAALRRAG